MPKVPIKENIHIKEGTDIIKFLTSYAKKKKVKHLAFWTKDNRPWEVMADEVEDHNAIQSKHNEESEKLIRFRGNIWLENGNYISHSHAKFRVEYNFEDGSQYIENKELHIYSAKPIGKKGAIIEIKILPTQDLDVYSDICDIELSNKNRTPIKSQFQMLDNQLKLEKSISKIMHTYRHGEVRGSVVNEININEILEKVLHGTRFNKEQQKIYITKKIKIFFENHDSWLPKFDYTIPTLDYIESPIIKKILEIKLFENIESLKDDLFSRKNDDEKINIFLSIMKIYLILYHKADLDLIPKKTKGIKNDKKFYSVLSKTWESSPFRNYFIDEDDNVEDWREKNESLIIEGFQGLVDALIDKIIELLKFIKGQGPHVYDSSSSRYCYDKYGVYLSDSTFLNYGHYEFIIEVLDKVKKQYGQNIFIKAIEKDIKHLRKISDSYLDAMFDRWKFESNWQDGRPLADKFSLINNLVINTDCRTGNYQRMKVKHHIIKVCKVCSPNVWYENFIAELKTEHEKIGLMHKK